MTTRGVQPSKLAELRQAIDGLILLAAWQRQLLQRAKSLLPKAPSVSASPRRRPRPRH